MNNSQQLIEMLMMFIKLSRQKHLQDGTQEIRRSRYFIFLIIQLKYFEGEVRYSFGIL